MTKQQRAQPRRVRYEVTFAQRVIVLAHMAGVLGVIDVLRDGWAAGFGLLSYVLGMAFVVFGKRRVRG